MDTHGTSLRRQGPRQFRFEWMWAGEKGCDEIIDQVWNSGGGNCGMEVVMSMIGRCTSNLKQWNQNCFGNVQKRLMEAKAHLQGVQSMDPTRSNMETINKAKHEVNV